MQLIGYVSRAFFMMIALTATVSAQGQPWRLGANGMLYTDSDNVTVVSSEVAVQHNLDESGSNIAASGIVDVTSAASVDVLSHATTRFNELRVEANLSGSYAIGDKQPGLRYRGKLWESEAADGYRCLLS